MKTRNKIIAGIVLASLLLPTACTDTTLTPEYPSCFDAPWEQNCTCPLGLENVSSPSGKFHFCVNASCSDTDYYFSLNGTCVESCPSEYAHINKYDTPDYSSPPFCLYIQNKSEMTCTEFPTYPQCICPEGLTVKSALGGSWCENVTCHGYLMHDSSCVDECPEGYEVAFAFDAGDAPFCVIESYYSIDRIHEETGCEVDGDCVWDQYETSSCCPCDLELVNKRTKGTNEKWRSENCAGEVNYSEWKWRLCPDNPYQQYNCNLAEEEEKPLFCRGSVCSTVKP